MEGDCSAQTRGEVLGPPDVAGAALTRARTSRSDGRLVRHALAVNGVCFIGSTVHPGLVVEPWGFQEAAGDERECPITRMRKKLRKLVNREGTATQLKSLIPDSV